MTDDALAEVWSLRRCSACSVLESDLRAVFVFDQGSDEIVHLVSNGTRRCGALVVIEQAAQRHNEPTQRTERKELVRDNRRV